MKKNFFGGRRPPQSVSLGLRGQRFKTRIFFEKSVAYATICISNYNATLPLAKTKDK